MIEVLPIGGLNEVGRNMTLLGFDGNYVIVDMGIRLDSILAFEDMEIGRMSRKELINIDAIPDDTSVRNKKVKAIVLTHGHLDHIGAVGKLALNYRAPVYGTPFTIAILKQQLKEERSPTPRPELIRAVPPNSTLRFGELMIEFIPITHSILHTVALNIGNGEESILVASDFKLDDNPLLGYKTDTDELRKLGNHQLTAAMVGSVRADEPGLTPSEAHAREMLREVMEESSNRRGLIFISTFSSHIARLKSIVDISYELGRTPVLVGRSLKNYCKAAINLGLVDFPPELKIHGRPNSAYNHLRRVGESREDYVLICTGHQGEPSSVLTRIADKKLPPKVQKGDSVIFSSSVIPSPINEANREILETKLDAQGAKIHRNIHVSGHARKEDTLKFLKLTRPQHLIPCHGTPEKLRALAKLAVEAGYDQEAIHVLKNGAAMWVGA